eukprot:6458934-Amphidinium_carterae.2
MKPVATPPTSVRTVFDVIALSSAVVFACLAPTTFFNNVLLDSARTRLAWKLQLQNRVATYCPVSALPCLFICRDVVWLGSACVLYKAIDRNHDGVITRSEWNQALLGCWILLALRMKGAPSLYTPKVATSLLGRHAYGFLEGVGCLGRGKWDSLLRSCMCPQNVNVTERSALRGANVPSAIAESDFCPP